ncbi:hypothetical protein DRO19_03015 [Candidatus Bathyarchaeota archaeon]|nr:MAG: hypothetical protein DRO19_03015 [Candidatus Bathyarchaeota archaeon]
MTELVNDRFGIFISPGTVYNTLHSLETKQLIEGVWRDKKEYTNSQRKETSF